MRNRWLDVPALHLHIQTRKKARWLDVFLDLIFVATVIQLGDALSDEVRKSHFVFWPMVKLVGLCAPLWSVWTGFLFYSNRFSIDDFLHRLLSFALMVSIGGMAIWAPNVAAGKDALAFSFANALACSFLALMYARTYWQVDKEQNEESIRKYCKHWAFIFFSSACIWTVSSFIPAPFCFLGWAAAVGILLAAPISRTIRAFNERFPIEQEHFSEHFGLLIIIILGGSFLAIVRQASLSVETQWGAILRVVFSLFMSYGVWWSYFDDVADAVLKKTCGAWFVWLYGHFSLTLAVVAVGMSLRNIVFIDFTLPMVADERWLLTVSLSVVFMAVAMLDSVTEGRAAGALGRSRAQILVFSAAMMLLLGQIGAYMSAAVFIGIVVALCFAQILFDMAVALYAGDDKSTDQHVPTAEIAAKIREGKAAVTTPRLEGVLRKGAPAELRNDLYFFFMEGSWWRLFVSFLGIYLVSNAFFAGLYLLEPGSISGNISISFSDAFAFSVQTMTTIGYGSMSPATPYGDFVVTLEAGIGLLGVAMATGLLFAKVSRPRSSVLFSNSIVVSKRHGVETLMFRVGNARGNEVVDASMTVTALFDDLSVEGHHMRRLVDLELVRNTSPIFALSWTIMHEIDEESPLKNVDLNGSDGKLVSIIVSMTGHDGTYGQTTYARKVFGAKDIHLNKRFVDVIHQLEDGRFFMDYTVFHELLDETQNDAVHEA